MIQGFISYSNTITLAVTELTCLIEGRRHPSYNYKCVLFPGPPAVRASICMWFLKFWNHVVHFNFMFVKTLICFKKTLFFINLFLIFFMFLI